MAVLGGAQVRTRSRGRRTRFAVAGLCLLLVATGCETQPPTVTQPPAGTQSPTAASIDTIEITPAAVLLTASGQTRPLTAVAQTAAGEAVETTVTWISSDPAVASVDAGGTVRAVAAVGSATITAAAGDVRSAPAYVTVAQPVAGAVLLTDAQIVSGPTIVNPAAEPAPDAPYEVVLRGVTGAAPGAILINGESLSVGGKVVSATPEGADTRVRLVVVPPGELFTAVEFNDTVDLGTGPYEIPADLAAAYDVTQTDGAFVFTPKPATTGALARPGLLGATLASWTDQDASGRPISAQAQGTRALPPFSSCERTAQVGGEEPMPVTLSAAPAFTFTAAGTATRQATSAGTKVVVQATPTFKFQTELEVKSAFEAKLVCKSTLVTRQFRVPGWAGLFFGGDVEFGVGFELSGKVTLVSAKVGGSAEIKPIFDATLDCPTGGACSLTGNASATTDLKPKLQAPSLNQAKFEPSVNLFAFVTLEAGNADIDQLQFEAIEAKAGVELAIGITLEGLQIDDAGEDGRSKYGLAFKGEVGPGIKLGEFLTYLGLSSVVPIKLAFEIPLGESPTGAVQADKPRYLPGETATVTVTLNPESTIFPSAVGIYNVNRVVIARRAGLLTEELATLDATDGQTTFTFTFTSPGLINAADLYGFVVTTLLPLDPPKLEIAAAKHVCAGDPATITSVGDDPDKIYVVFDGASTCRLVAEIGDDHFPGDGSDVALSIDTDPDETTWDAEDSDDDSDGLNWQEAGGFGQNFASGSTRTFRSRHVATGQVFEITVTVRVELVSGGNTRMTVQDVSISLVP